MPQDPYAEFQASSAPDPYAEFQQPSRFNGMPGSGPGGSVTPAEAAARAAAESDPAYKAVEQFKANHPGIYGAMRQVFYRAADINPGAMAIPEAAPVASGLVGIVSRFLSHPKTIEAAKDVGSELLKEIPGVKTAQRVLSVADKLKIAAADANSPVDTSALTPKTPLPAPLETPRPHVLAPTTLRPAPQFEPPPLPAPNATAQAVSAAQRIAEGEGSLAPPSAPNVVTIPSKPAPPAATFQAAARAAKVTKLADALDGQIPIEDVARMTDEHWKTLAKGLGINAPSKTSIADVMLELQKRQAAKPTMMQPSPELLEALKKPGALSAAQALANANSIWEAAKAAKAVTP